MSETKHTPRPWTTKPETDYVPAQIWAEGRQLAEVYGESREIRARNAQLMATAPELLETVIAYRLHHKLMLNVVDDTDCPCKICQLAETAIGKAKAK